MTTFTQNRISIVELESAINFWRSTYPSARDTMTLCPQAAVLAEQYAHMIIFHLNDIEYNELSESAKASIDEARARLGNPV